tara:strand:+ start:451 stop:582 length:132 start_codon:yes stop_codon:yes gene_type:complete
MKPISKTWAIIALKEALKNDERYANLTIKEKKEILNNYIESES